MLVPIYQQNPADFLKWHSNCSNPAGSALVCNMQARASIFLKDGFREKHHSAAAWGYT
jgi:hypothetical protein